MSATFTAVILTTFIALFPIVNPFGAVPFFLSISANLTPDRRGRILRKTTVYVFFILIIFLFAGNLVLRFFNISLPAIRIAGGLLLYRIGQNMLMARPKFETTKEEEDESLHKQDVSFTPLAMPMLSGPGSIAVALGLSDQIQNLSDYAAMTVAVLLVAGATFLILRASTFLLRILGYNGMNVMTRMMGFITLCISVQFIVNGTTAVLRTL
ncbi:MAG: MarC family NAAT transporter [candidate division KSB1 bacterium]|nr:MarC family NAAT transporter [candidate division KSB1 bacterium]